ncbi:MAG: hypothetical protein WA784_12185 [Albidovulum sp.]
MKPLHILLAALVLATPAQAFTAQNGLAVENTARGFAVPWRGPSGAADFWCAAGDYVVRGLGQSPTTRIYRLTERPRPAGGAMAFSLSPEGAADATGIFTLIGGQGAAMSAATAHFYCEIKRKGRSR